MNPCIECQGMPGDLFGEKVPRAPESKKCGPKRGWAEYCDPFTTWYMAYPKHEDKLMAHREWHTLERKGQLPTLEILLRRLALHRRARRWQDKKYIPSPRTYLHQHRWADELELTPQPVAHVAKPLSPDDIEYRKRYHQKYGV